MLNNKFQREKIKCSGLRSVKCEKKVNYSLTTLILTCLFLRRRRRRGGDTFDLLKPDDYFLFFSTTPENTWYSRLTSSLSLFQQTRISCSPVQLHFSSVQSSCPSTVSSHRFCGAQNTDTRAAIRRARATVPLESS